MFVYEWALTSSTHPTFRAAIDLDIVHHSPIENVHILAQILTQIP